MEPSGLDFELARIAQNRAERAEYMRKWRAKRKKRMQERLRSRSWAAVGLPAPSGTPAIPTVSDAIVARNELFALRIQADPLRPSELYDPTEIAQRWPVLAGGIPKRDVTTDITKPKPAQGQLVSSLAGPNPTLRPPSGKAGQWQRAALMGEERDKLAAYRDYDRESGSLEPSCT